MWKNILLLDWPHIWQYGTCAMHDEYLSLQTLLRICNTYCFSTATMVARTHPSVTLYVHYLSCFNHPQTSGRMSDLTGITFINEGEKIIVCACARMPLPQLAARQYLKYTEWRVCTSVLFPYLPCQFSICCGPKVVAAVLVHYSITFLCHCGRNFEYHPIVPSQNLANDIARIVTYRAVSVYV
jgi:hypothetical protein